MTWKIIDYFDDNVTVEYEDKSRLNFNVRSIIEPRKPVVYEQNQIAYEQNQIGTGMKIAGSAYAFDQGGILPTHTHDAPDSLHTIECMQGRVMVRREQSGDIILNVGNIATIALGEKHSIEALEPSKTVHWKV